MAVTWFGSGTGVEDTTGPWSATRASTVAGNIIIGQVMADGDTTGTTQTLGTCTNIENLAGTDDTMTVLASADCGGNGWQYLWIGRSVAGGTVTFAGTTAGNDVYIQVHAFTGCHTGTALADVIENGTAGSVVTGSGTDASIEAPTVTTLGADRLAVCCIGVNDDNSLGHFTGESGGDWELRASFLAAAGTDGSIGLETAAMASAGTVSGGSFTMSVADPWGVVGFALIPAGAPAPAPFPALNMGRHA